MSNRSQLVGYGLVLAGSTMFAFKAIFIKLAYQGAPDALLMLVWRMIFALPLFLAAGLYALWFQDGLQRLKKSPRRVVEAAAVGFIGYYLAMILDFEGLVRVSAQLERLTLFTYPIFVFALGALLFRMKLTLGHAISAAVSYAGLACVFIADMETAGSNVPLGTLLVLGSAISFALYQLLAKPLIGALGSSLFTSVALASAAIASILHFILMRGFDFSATPHFLLLAAATAVIATVIPSYFVNAGMGRIGAASTAMISTLSPLITIYFAILLLNEEFGLTDGIGTALVVAGIGNHTWRELRTGSSQVIESSQR